jgi:hypothetical protein
LERIKSGVPFHLSFPQRRKGAKRTCTEESNTLRPCGKLFSANEIHGRNVLTYASPEFCDFDVFRMNGVGVESGSISKGCH